MVYFYAYEVKSPLGTIAIGDGVMEYGTIENSKEFENVREQVTESITKDMNLNSEEYKIMFTAFNPL